MLGFLLNRFREGKAVRSLEAGISGAGPPEAALAAAARLRDIGGRKSIQPLCFALTHAPEALRAECATALAGVHQRHPDQQILEALNAAVLSDRQAEKVRAAAALALGNCVDARRAGSLIEILKSPRSPIPVRSAAVQALKKLGYIEVLERLVENYLFSREEDPSGRVRAWAVEELQALDDHEKLTKIHEIAHSRRKLRFRAVAVTSPEVADLVHLMALVDAAGATRFLSHMVDESTRVIADAAAQELEELRRGAKRSAQAPQAGGPAAQAAPKPDTRHGPRTTTAAPRKPPPGQAPTTRK